MNAIRHGNRMDPDKWVRVVFHAASDRFDVCITDEGAGFDFDSRLDPWVTTPIPGGRGLFLMSNFMTEVGYCGRGNVVAMSWVRRV